MGKMKVQKEKNYIFRIVAIIIIQAFLVLDVAWSGEKVSTLSPKININAPVLQEIFLKKIAVEKSEVTLGASTREAPRLTGTRRRLNTKRGGNPSKDPLILAQRKSWRYKKAQLREKEPRDEFPGYSGDGELGEEPFLSPSPQQLNYFTAVGVRPGEFGKIVDRFTVRELVILLTDKEHSHFKVPLREIRKALGERNSRRRHFDKLLARRLGTVGVAIRPRVKHVNIDRQRGKLIEQAI